MTAILDAPAVVTADDVREAAYRWHAAGFTVLPVMENGTKRPDVDKWTHYQHEQPTVQQLARWYDGTGRTGLGVVTGAISGNVEMFELEGRAVAEGARERIIPALKAAGVYEVWQRLVAGYVDISPTGGPHFIYRLDDREVPKNTKVASRPKKPEELTDADRALLKKFPKKIIPFVLAETRGEGGFTVVAPSHGGTHKSGCAWEISKKSQPGKIVTITWDERVALFAAIHAVLDEMPEPEPIAPCATIQPTSDGSERPGEAWARVTPWADILQPHGWKLIWRRGDMDFWRRPGDDKKIGWSARTGGTFDGLWVWSTSTPFPTEESITKFRAYSVLEHGGKDREAAAQLRRDGHGGKRSATAQAPTPGTTAVAKDHAEVAEQDSDDQFLASIRRLTAAKDILSRFTGSNPGIPPLDVMDELYDLLHQAVNPDGMRGKARMEFGPDYPTKWLPPPMQAQLSARGALAASGVSAGMLGCGSTAAMSAELYVEGTRRVPPTLWVPSLGDAGSGKTPAAELALEPLRACEAEALRQYIAEAEGWHALDRADQKKVPRPKNPARLLDDTTIELVARRLKGSGGQLAVISDELAGPLRALGQYKKDGGSDRARFLSLWSGQPWTYERVGSGDEPLFIAIEKPIFPVFGTIQPEFASLLGDVGSGMQARWLPHMCGPREGTETGRTADEWRTAINKLLASQGYRRQWDMPGDSEARRELLVAARRWSEEQRDPAQTAASSSFMAKAEEHASRVALVLAEIDAAGRAVDKGTAVRPGEIPVWAVRAAVDLVDYCAAVWRALPNTEAPMTLSYADKAIVERDGKLNAWLRGHGGSATKREIQLAKVGGARTPADVKALIKRHVDIYGPDAVVDEGRGSIRVFAR